jgi:hypothetical protein
MSSVILSSVIQKGQKRDYGDYGLSLGNNNNNNNNNGQSGHELDGTVGPLSLTAHGHRRAFSPVTCPITAASGKPLSLHPIFHPTPHKLQFKVTQAEALSGK